MSEQAENWTLSVLRDIEKLSSSPVDCIEVCCQSNSGIGTAVQARHGRHVRIGIFEDNPAEDRYHCDLSTKEGFERGLALIKKLKPRWLFCAPPCTAHCGLQMLNAYKSEANWKRLQKKKKHSRKIYKSCVVYCDTVEGQGGIPVWETGASATTWQEECLQDQLRRYYEVILDQCAYGCVHPKSGRPVQKKTRLISTSPKIFQLQRRCKCQEQHDHAKGGGAITGPLAYYPKQMCMKIASMIVPFKDKVYRHEESILQVDSVLMEYADDYALAHQEDDEDIGKTF